MKNAYETLFIVKPTLTEEEINATVEKVKEVLAKVDAELRAELTMGMRRLAYPVQKHERGYYTVFYYNAPGSAIAELERNLKYDENVIKFMTVKYSNKRELAQFEKQVAAAKKAPEATSEEAPASEESAEA